MPTAWRPPTSPKGRTRRKRAIPSRAQSEEGLMERDSISPLAQSPEPVSRSHSQDDLDDLDTTRSQDDLDTTRSQDDLDTTRSQDDLDTSRSQDDLDTSRSQNNLDRTPLPPSRTHSLENVLDTPSSQLRPVLEKSTSLCEDLDKISDSVASDSDTLKRKKNFMDRCVNKVRSLIKK
ncbi:hypothetical protein LSTR_LSTR007946 [Laodelphax striatellus]|uniref:Uncharacterized protein n=1 Tax=Laodelphax striatellus TaxID=195883 RepID=A0A482XG96_LAOST|nr:hypothetical protein LSTR_LSTR007946 [Laodelphax striatellus]